MSTTDLPKFVNYGGLGTVPSPFQSLGTTLYAFILEADIEKLRSFCKQVFSDPSRGQAEYVPLTRFVMMTVGNIEKIIPAAPFDQIGYSSEGQVAFWIFTAAVKRGPGGISIAQRPAVFVPYIFVQNAFSFACGREVEGYPKNWGWFDFPEAANTATPPPALENFTLDCWGLKTYAPTEKVAQTRLMEITCGEPLPGEMTHTRWGSMQEAFQDLRTLLFDKQDGTVILPGLHMAESLFDDLLQHQLPEVFLKQYRDVRDAQDACYQAIVEVPNKVMKFDGGLLHDRYNFKLEQVASHPMADQLGLKDQESALSFWLKMDFVVENGKVIWQSPSGGTGCLFGLFRLLGG